MCPNDLGKIKIYTPMLLALFLTAVAGTGLGNKWEMNSCTPKQPI